MLQTIFKIRLLQFAADLSKFFFRVFRPRRSPARFINAQKVKKTEANI